MYEVLKPVLFPVHPAGWPFIILFAGVTVVVGLFWAPFYIVGGALTLWCLCFFRNPERVTPTREGLIVRSEEHTSELQSLLRISYAVFCLQKTPIIQG